MKTFNTGNKVKCIDDGGHLYLTIGKVYEVIKTNRAGDEIYISDDSKITRFYFGHRFELATSELDLPASIALAQSLVGKAFKSPKYGVGKFIAEKAMVYLPGHDFTKYGSMNAKTELEERGFSVCLDTTSGMEYPVSSVEIVPQSTTLKLTEDYDAIIYKDKVEVGCQTIPKDVLVELLAKMEEL